MMTTEIAALDGIARLLRERGYVCSLITSRTLLGEERWADSTLGKDASQPGFLAIYLNVFASRTGAIFLEGDLLDLDINVHSGSTKKEWVGRYHLSDPDVINKIVGRLGPVPWWNLANFVFSKAVDLLFMGMEAVFRQIISK